MTNMRYASSYVHCSQDEMFVYLKMLSEVTLFDLLYLSKIFQKAVLNSVKGWSFVKHFLVKKMSNPLQTYLFDN